MFNIYKAGKAQKNTHLFLGHVWKSPDFEFDEKIGIFLAALSLAILRFSRIVKRNFSTTEICYAFPKSKIVSVKYMHLSFVFILISLNYYTIDVVVKYPFRDGVRLGEAESYCRRTHLILHETVTIIYIFRFKIEYSS